MQRNLSIDILKFGLAIMIVALHGSFLGDLSQTISYLLIDGLFRIAVPIFFLINGYYFSRSLSAPSPWFKRGLILYLVWMLIYSYYWLHPPNETLSPVYLAKIFLVGYGHLWYIVSMLAAAAALYCLQKLSSRLLLSLSLGLYILGATIQYLGNYHVFTDISWDEICNTVWFYRNPQLFAFPFFCIGYLLEKHQIQQKITTRYAMQGAAIGLALLACESFINLRLAAKPEPLDMMFSLLLASPFIFIVFLRIDIKGSSKNFALYSTAIYLVHYMVLAELYKSMHLPGTILTLAGLAISLAISTVLIKANRKLKYLL